MSGSSRPRSATARSGSDATDDTRATTSVDQRLGMRMRARRLAIGLSQERLAELLGVTFQQIQKYEKGVNRIAASRLFDICVALDVSVDYFFEGLTISGGVSPPPSEASAVVSVLATPEGIELVRLFVSVKSVKVRRRVVQLVSALAGDSERR